MNTSPSLQELPIGIQDFVDLRRSNYLYVDKTKYLIELIDRGKVYFLSRPRRFGKSLTVSTFDALFSGQRELFKGLYAESFFDRPGFKPLPVVRLDMSTVTTNKDDVALQETMLLGVLKNAKQHGVELSELAQKNPGSALSELIGKIAQAHGPVVVLVDEYDKPILDALGDPERLHAFRATLSNFYVQIKASDAYTRFVFFTGISKFSKMGVFSAMNQLNDISFDDEYAEMLGYTRNELETCFADHIDETVRHLGTDRSALLDRMKGYYNGFSFNGTQPVYNPFSILQFFQKKQFRNFWFESGQPSFITHYIERHQLSIESFRGLPVDSDFASSREIEAASPASFLYQAGYLTLRERRIDERFRIRYVLDYPNEEVSSSMAHLFIKDVCQLDTAAIGYGDALVAAFDAGDTEEAVAIFNRLLAAIPYNLFDDKEKYYHSVIYCMVIVAGLDARAEDRSKAGSSDIVVQRRGRFTVIEIKLATAGNADKAAAAAIDQIKKRGYAEKFPPEATTLLGLAIDPEARKIAAYTIA